LPDDARETPEEPRNYLGICRESYRNLLSFKKTGPPAYRGIGRQVIGRNPTLNETEADRFRVPVPP
jgi:hypothetical protein